MLRIVRGRSGENKVPQVVIRVLNLSLGLTHLQSLRPFVKHIPSTHRSRSQSYVVIVVIPYIQREEMIQRERGRIKSEDIQKTPSLP